eukprot:scaffold56385_cov61-Phaeocystis_antarctica.AAC.1
MVSPTRPVMVRPMMKGRRRPNREVQRSEAWPRSSCSQSDIAGFARNTKDAVEAGQNWSRNGSITTSPEDQVNSTAAPMAEIATKVLSGGAPVTGCIAIIAVLSTRRSSAAKAPSGGASKLAFTMLAAAAAASAASLSGSGSSLR